MGPHKCLNLSNEEKKKIKISAYLQKLCEQDQKVHTGQINLDNLLLFFNSVKKNYTSFVWLLWQYDIIFLKDLRSKNKR